MNTFQTSVCTGGSPSVSEKIAVRRTQHMGTDQEDYPKSEKADLYTNVVHILFSILVIHA